MDILFLDIDLKGESGIELAAQLMVQYPEIVVIFMNGHREFAGEAFEVEAMGYLVKPLDLHKTERILKKAVVQVNGRRRQRMERELVITHENNKKKISMQKILYVQRERTKSVLHTEEKEYVVYETMSVLYERLGEGFLRINQGENVNIRQIAEIKKNIVYLKNGMEMSVGRTYRQEVKERYFIINFGKCIGAVCFRSDWIEAGVQIC